MSQALDDQRLNPYSFDGSAAPTRSGILPDDTVYWIPTDGATLHNGKPIPEKMSFPFLPHEEIGEVISAYSNFGSRKIFGFNRKLFRYSYFISMTCLLASQFVLHLRTLLSIQLFVILFFTITVLWLSSFVMGWIKPAKECSYVGQLGYVRWYRRKKTFFHNLVLFENCSYNKYERTVGTSNGSGVGMDLYNLVEKDGTRHEYFISFDPAEMGHSIDLAWTKFILRKARAEFETGHHFDIRADKELVIRFFAHHVELMLDWRAIRVTKQELVLFRFAYDMNIKFFIRLDLAMGRSGEFLIPFAEIHNYRAFLILVSHVLETKLEGKSIELLPAWHLGTW
jgi:hypothetical protein